MKTRLERFLGLGCEFGRRDSSGTTEVDTVGGFWKEPGAKGERELEVGILDELALLGVLQLVDVKDSLGFRLLALAVRLLDRGWVDLFRR